MWSLGTDQRAMSIETHDTERRALKRAARESIEQLGGIEAAGTLTRVSKTMLARYYDPADPAVMPVDVQTHLEKYCDPHVLRQQARICGYRLVPLDREDGEGSINRMLSDAALSHGALTSEYLTATADGHINAEEAEQLEAVAIKDIENRNRVLAKISEIKGKRQS
ncbi:Hypothetical protein GbCGDNIH2_7310 [Granulibacter bethesdensis]|nr:Hypothetical protein GbCGDNIH2_7310 [Granulibacter bethesdensis]